MRFAVLNRIARMENKMHAKQQNNTAENPTASHADFSVCLQCEPCGGGCTFLDNRVVFVKNAATRHVSHIQFDTSLAVCGAQCGKHCVSGLKLAEVEKKTTNDNSSETMNFRPKIHYF